MNVEELNRLLEKYYKGESTEEEEKTLREYFKENNVTEGYEAEKDIFGYFRTDREVPEPSFDFEARILAGIDASDSKRGSQKIRKYVLLSLSAAAGLLVLAGSYFFLVSRTEPGDTFTNPEIAYAETMKILIDVSSQLNHGAQALEPVSKINEMTTKSFEAINKSTRIIEKNLKNLDYIQKAIEITNVPVDNKINK
jgi:hypothetical protein